MPRLRAGPAVIALLALGHLVVDLYQGTIPALLPVWKQRFHLPYAAAGAVVLALQVSSSIVQPLFGLLGDRVESRLWLPGAVALAAAGTAFAAAAGSFAAVLVGVVIGGLGIALYHPEGARRAHDYGGDRKATAQSGFVLGGNVGMALGPALAALWLGRGSGWLVAFLVLVGLACSALLMFAMPHPRRPQGVRPGRKGGGPTGGLAREGWKALGILALVVVLRAWVHHGLQTIMPLYLVEQGMAPSDVQKLLSVFLLAGAAGTAVGGPVADAVGRKPVIVASMAMAAGLLTAMARASPGWSMVFLVLTGFVVVSTFSVATVMAQELLPGRVGTATGFILGLTVGTGGVGATLLGLAADRWGVAWVLQRLPLLPLASMALASLLPSGPSPARRGVPVSAGQVRAERSR